MSKVLVFDIETSPSIAYVWRFFKESISPKQVLDHPHIMSYAAKWLGKGEIFYEENRGGKEKELLRTLVS